VPRLRELEATFLRLDAARTGQSFTEVGDVLAGSDGVLFLCPKCFVANKGSVGTHSVICWWVGVPEGVSPKPGRWTPSGTGLDDLTFVPSEGRSTSVALLGGCQWHGFVTNGAAA
jgi:hypothetical protein